VVIAALGLAGVGFALLAVALATMQMLWAWAAVAVCVGGVLLLAAAGLRRSGK
jgi:hypothetical protein